ncbi:MAG: hypothetical protein ACREQ7_02885 [Candidatus Binatia bacterium]
MGLFDTIQATLTCPVCGSGRERQIQTKKGPCAMLNLEIGDTIEPFFYGDYWLEEEWDCDDCRKQTSDENRWHKVFIHCINGLIVEVAPERPPLGKLPDWDLVHKLSRERLRYRQALRIVRGSVLRFKERMAEGEAKRQPFLDIGPKTIEELLDDIIEEIGRAERGEPAGWF